MSTEHTLCARKFGHSQEYIDIENRNPVYHVRSLQYHNKHDHLVLACRAALLVEEAGLSCCASLPSTLLRCFHPLSCCPLSRAWTAKVQVPLCLGSLPGHLEFIPGTRSRQIPILLGATNAENTLESSLTFLFKQLSANLMFAELARTPRCVHVWFYRKDAKQK